MWKVTRKGLIANKLRFLLTAIAVILGVAFISGTFVFAATIQHTFDDLIGNIYKGTDAQVRGPEIFKNDQGGPGSSPRPPIAARVQFAAVAAADRVHFRIGMPLINRNELRAKAQSNDGDIDLLAGHGGWNRGEKAPWARKRAP